MFYQTHRRVIKIETIYFDSALSPIRITDGSFTFSLVAKSIESVTRTDLPPEQERNNGTRARMTSNAIHTNFLQESARLQMKVPKSSYLHCNSIEPLPLNKGSVSLALNLFTLCYNSFKLTYINIKGWYSVTRPSGLKGFATITMGQVASITGTAMTQFGLSYWVWQEFGRATHLVL